MPEDVLADAFVEACVSVLALLEDVLVLIVLLFEGVSEEDALAETFVETEDELT